jgi:hypothetical protein
MLIQEDPTTTTTLPVTTTTECFEEMPCWDCSEMGNLICGPVEIIDAVTIERADPVPMQTLPVTGIEGSLVLVGAALIATGSILVRKSKAFTS